ncbi:MAG: NAD(P)-dependent oxidoreductase [Acutalibacteraceae bacterium]|nr:NAD(P)-dependent oxidoreductase [Acutalibacteraceae bacterium]
MNIVIPDLKTVTNGDVSIECFDSLGTVTAYPLSEKSVVSERVKEADIILCNKTPMCKETLDSAKNLRYIGLFATGYNNIDLDYTSKRGITVCNAAGYSTNAVAQHTFALILEHFSKVAEYDRFVRDGGWIKSDVFSPIVYPTEELAGKTIGIIGMGSIGKRVSALAEAFEMNVLYYSRSNSNTDLDNLVSSSDVVTVHCPLNVQSSKMFNKEMFEKFKHGAFFVNTSRGGTVDELALRYALDSGILSGAAVDVLENEPMSESCPLIGAKNLIITPHCAWAPEQTREKLVKIVYNNLKSFLDGNPVNVVVPG